MFERKLFRSDMISCALCMNAPCSKACSKIDPADVLRSAWFDNEKTAADRLPGASGFSFGLLTFALFLGFAPEYLGLAWVRAGWMYALLALASLALLLPCLRRRTS